MALFVGAGVAMFEHTVVVRFDTFDAIAINVLLFGLMWGVITGLRTIRWPNGENAVDTVHVEGMPVSEAEERRERRPLRRREPPEYPPNTPS